MPRKFCLALFAAGVGSLGLVPGAHAAFRVGPNYRLNSDQSEFRGKDQVALAVDPGNPRHIVEVNANYLTEDCEATTSYDGGATWTAASTLSPPAAAAAETPFANSCFVGNHLAESMFQTVTFGTGQTVYTVSRTLRVDPAGGHSGASVLLFKSVDGGKTWAPGVIAMPGGASDKTGPYYELPTVTVDPGAGAAGADRVYTVAHETTGFGNSGPPCPVPTAPPPPAPQPAPSCPSVMTAVSNDGGASFSPVVQASPPGVAIAGPDSASPPVVNPDHSVSVAWRTLGYQGLIEVTRSTDAGRSWGAPVDATAVTAGGRVSPSHVTPSMPTGSSFPRLAGDKHNGNLYLVYGQGPDPGPTAPTGGYRGADHFINPDSRVYFQRSLDHGLTWSTPKLIDDNPAYPGSQTIETRHPSISVAPNGRIDIVWEDRRHWYQGPGERDCVHTHAFCDDARLGDTYYAYSTDGGRTFSPNIRISDRSHNNDVGFDYRFGTGWAFGPQAVALGNDQLLVGWMDSREGSFDNDNQDIYLAKVSFNAPSAIPQTAIDQSDPVALSVALSQFTYPGGGEGLLNSTFATRNGTRVVIVNSQDPASALAGSVLARANLAPVLLTPPGGLPASVKAEISRLDPAGAFLLGDSGQLSAQVNQDLLNAGIDQSQIVRLSANDAPSMAAQIAAQFDRRTPVEKAAGNPAFDAAVIANPASPDAGAAAALAAARRLPILYVSASSIPAATAAALSSLNIGKTLVIGGPQVVGDALLGGLPSPTRLGGPDQYATSHAVATESVARGLPGNIVYAADGTKPMDAALLGAAVGRLNGILVLSRGPLYATAPGTASADGLHAIDQLVLAGPAAPPFVSRFRVTNRKFAVRRTPTPLFGTAAASRRHEQGTTFQYTLSEAATARIVIVGRLPGRARGGSCVAPTAKLHRARRCTRIVAEGSLTRRSHPGANRVAFSGRIGSRALRPGGYEATLTVTDAGNRRSAPKRTSFTVVAR